MKEPASDKEEEDEEADAPRPKDSSPVPTTFAAVEEAFHPSPPNLMRQFFRCSSMMPALNHGVYMGTKEGECG